MTLSKNILDYSEILCASAEKCTIANERQLYDLHMKEALKWLVELHRGLKENEVELAIHLYVQAYGKSYLSEDYGAETEKAFYKLRDSLKTKSM